MRAHVRLDGGLRVVERAAHRWDDAGEESGLVACEPRADVGVHPEPFREAHRFGGEGGAGGSGVAVLAVGAEDDGRSAMTITSSTS